MVKFGPSICIVSLVDESVFHGTQLKYDYNQLSSRSDIILSTIWEVVKDLVCLTDFLAEISLLDL